MAMHDSYMVHAPEHQPPHLQGAVVAKTVAQVGAGVAAGHALNRYLGETGVFDKYLADAKTGAVDPGTLSIAKGAVSVAIGAGLAWKVPKLRIFGVGMIVDGLLEVILPKVDSAVDDAAAKANAANQLPSGGQTAGAGATGQ